MNALVNVLVDEVLHYHVNGDCQEPAERSRLWSELHCCQDEDEDEVQVIGCCHDQDDGCFVIASLDLLLLGLLDLVLLGLPFLGCP